MTNTDTPKLSSKMFERSTCWKCDGTGHIVGFEHVHGGDCFACGATGGRLTARGKRQMAAYDAVMELPVEKVTEGQRVNCGGYTGRITVETIERHEDGRVTLNGNGKQGRVGYTALPGGTVRLVLKRAELNALITQCLEVR